MIQRCLIILITFVAFTKPLSGRVNCNRYHFKINKKEYRFSTFFEIDSEDSSRGCVKKSWFRIRTNYDLSDRNGWQATGIVRVLSLGSFFPWAKEIDVYDTQWKYLGMIDGQAVTTAAARFSIYNRENTLVGIAFLDENKCGFTVTHPDSEAYTVARLKRNFIMDTIDDWDVVVYEPEQIDARIMKIFASFVVDFQNEFQKDL